MSTAVIHDRAMRAPSRTRSRSPFFVLLGLLLLVTAIGGFWPQYFAVAVGGTAEPTTQFWLIHLHAALFVGWMLAYIYQSALVLSGRTATHLKTGPWLAAFGFVTALIGLFAAGKLAARFGERMRDFDAGASFVFFPLIDMVYFAAFLAVALQFRKRPQIHKRAMFVATFSIAVVGWGRLVGRFGYESPWVWQSLILAPLLLVIAYDLASQRKVYWVMVAGLAVHLLRLNADRFVESEWWLPLGRTLVAPFS